MKLLDAEDVIEAIAMKELFTARLDYGYAEDNLNEWRDYAEGLLRGVPEVDAIEVVRCKDCKYYNAIDTDRLSECLKGFEVYGNDYCSYGGRRIR